MFFYRGIVVLPIVKRTFAQEALCVVMALGGWFEIEAGFAELRIVRLFELIRITISVLTSAGVGFSRRQTMVFLPTLMAALNDSSRAANIARDSPTIVNEAVIDRRVVNSA